MVSRLIGAGAALVAQHENGLFGVANFEKSSWTAMASFMVAGIITTNLIYRVLVG